MLEVRGLQSSYGQSQALFGIDLHIEAGSVATLLGRNGMGKTTTVKTLFGLLPIKAGEARFRGTAIGGLQPHQIGRLGLSLVPEGRQIFPTLSVRENLIATSANRSNRADRWTLERIHALFPRLEQRAHQQGGALSGGEQQMLAIGRALMTNPHLLILDEATEGLAPIVREEIYACLRGLKDEGQSILIIDKNIDELTSVADSHTIIEKGVTRWCGSNEEFIQQVELRERYLGV